LNRAQVFRYAIDNILDLLLLTGAIRVGVIQRHTPDRHLPRTVGSRAVTPIDGPAHLVRRKLTAVPVRKAREVRRLHLEVSRDGAITLAVAAITCRAEPLIRLLPVCCDRSSAEVGVSHKAATMCASIAVPGVYFMFVSRVSCLRQPHWSAAQRDGSLLCGKIVRLGWRSWPRAAQEEVLYLENYLDPPIERTFAEQVGRYHAPG
jgi:hypothetical protein